MSDDDALLPVLAPDVPQRPETGAVRAGDVELHWDARRLRIRSAEATDELDGAGRGSLQLSWSARAPSATPLLQRLRHRNRPWIHAHLRTRTVDVRLSAPAPPGANIADLPRQDLDGHVVRLAELGDVCRAARFHGMALARVGSAAESSLPAQIDEAPTETARRGAGSYVGTAAVFAIALGAFGALQFAESVEVAFGLSAACVAFSQWTVARVRRVFGFPQSNGHVAVRWGWLPAFERARRVRKEQTHPAQVGAAAQMLLRLFGVVSGLVVWAAGSTTPMSMVMIPAMAAWLSAFALLLADGGDRMAAGHIRSLGDHARVEGVVVSPDVVLRREHNVRSAARSSIYTDAEYADALVVRKSDGQQVELRVTPSTVWGSLHHEFERFDQGRDHRHVFQIARGDHVVATVTGESAIDDRPRVLEILGDTRPVASVPRSSRLTRRFWQTMYAIAGAVVLFAILRVF